jgi:hypothetical protein
MAFSRILDRSTTGFALNPMATLASVVKLNKLSTPHTNDFKTHEIIWFPPAGQLQDV